MEDDNKFWIIIWAMVSFTVSFIALLVFLTTIAEKAAIAESANPIATACALASTGSTIPASCSLSQQATTTVRIAP